jgi:hypothetical protein
LERPKFFSRPAARLQCRSSSPCSGTFCGRNADLYGKCNNPRGHGHRYLTEADDRRRLRRAQWHALQFSRFGCGDGSCPCAMAGQNISISRRKNSGKSLRRGGKYRPRPLAEINRQLDDRLLRHPPLGNA